jgi:hypothetical protein
MKSNFFVNTIIIITYSLIAGWVYFYLLPQIIPNTLSCNGVKYSEKLNIKGYKSITTSNNDFVAHYPYGWNAEKKMYFVGSDIKLEDLKNLKACFPNYSFEFTKSIDGILNGCVFKDFSPTQSNYPEYECSEN